MKFLHGLPGRHSYRKGLSKFREFLPFRPSVSKLKSPEGSFVSPRLDHIVPSSRQLLTSGSPLLAVVFRGPADVDRNVHIGDLGEIEIIRYFQHHGNVVCCSLDHTASEPRVCTTACKRDPAKFALQEIGSQGLRYTSIPLLWSMVSLGAVTVACLEAVAAVRNQ